MNLLKVYEVFTPRNKGRKGQEAEPTRVLHTGTLKDVLADLHKAGHKRISERDVRYSHFI